MTRLPPQRITTSRHMDNALLHVGAEYAIDERGTTIHHTVFVLGHDDPPAFSEPVEIVFPELPPTS